ncbi:MAG: hypothetical protein KC561_10280, partial [Myxococcales bacterium]|nr:hypothetical protein [Myxococcales bacterium]
MNGSRRLVVARRTKRLVGRSWCQAALVLVAILAFGAASAYAQPIDAGQTSDIENRGGAERILHQLQHRPWDVSSEDLWLLLASPDRALVDSAIIALARVSTREALQLLEERLSGDHQAAVGVALMIRDAIFGDLSDDTRREAEQIVQSTESTEWTSTLDAYRRHAQVIQAWATLSGETPSSDSCQGMIIANPYLAEPVASGRLRMVLDSDSRSATLGYAVGGSPAEELLVTGRRTELEWRTAQLEEAVADFEALLAVASEVCANWQPALSVERSETTRPPLESNFEGTLAFGFYSNDSPLAFRDGAPQSVAEGQSEIEFEPWLRLMWVARGEALGGKLTLGDLFTPLGDVRRGWLLQGRLNGTLNASFFEERSRPGAELVVQGRNLSERQNSLSGSMWSLSTALLTGSESYLEIERFPAAQVFSEAQLSLVSI